MVHPWIPHRALPVQCLPYLPCQTLVMDPEDTMAHLEQSGFQVDMDAMELTDDMVGTERPEQLATVVSKDSVVTMEQLVGMDHPETQERQDRPDLLELLEDKDFLGGKDHLVTQDFLEVKDHEDHLVTQEDRDFQELAVLEAVRPGR